MASDAPIPLKYTDTPTDQQSPSYERSVSVNMDPNQSEMEIAQTVRDMWNEARQARGQMVRTWNRCYRALRARPRNDGPVADWEPNVRVPELYPLVRADVALKLDQRIITKVSPAGPSGTQFRDRLTMICSDLEAVMESSHHVNREEIEYEKMLFDAATYGTGILKTVWDPSLADGDGDATIKRVSPYCFGPDPSATNEHDGDWYIEARPMSPQAIDRMWPGKGKLFLTSGSDVALDSPPSQLTSPSDQPRIIPGAISPATAPRTGKQMTQETMLDVEPIVVLEAWIKEHDVSKIEGGPEDGKEIAVVRWRVVVVANNHVLMNERAEDLWEHGQHPYDRFVPQDLGEFWGLGLVELLGPTQAALNRVLQAVQRHIEITGNPVLKEDFGALSQQSQLAGNRPGQRLSKRTGKEVDWMVPPPLSSEVPTFIQFLLARMESISGLSALARGGIPQGRPAQGVVDALQEVAFVSIRLQLLNLESCLRGAYTKKACLIAENYTEPRFVSITGPDGQPTSQFLSAYHFYDGPDDAAPLQYVIRVDAGSSSHTSRKVREDRAQIAYTLGAISILDYLEAIEWPNPHLAVQRKTQEAQSALAVNPQAPGKRERARA